MCKNGWQKILVKVIRDGSVQWVHVSTVPKKLYYDFLRITDSTSLDLNYYLYMWCKDDFDVTLRMSKYEDIYHLKKAINERFEAEYEELYGEERMVQVRGWVRMWLIQHMKEEIAIVKNGGKE